MTDEELRRRFAEGRVARLATVTPRGTPHVVPCCFALAEAAVYSAVDAKPKSTLALQRLANIEANRDVSLLVDHYNDDWSQLWWVRADGVAHVVIDDRERSTAIELLEAKYDQYADVGIEGPVIAVDVKRWRGWSYA